MYGELIILKPWNIKKSTSIRLLLYVPPFFPTIKRYPRPNFPKTSQMLFLDITQNSISLSRDYKKIYLEQN